MQLNQFKIIFGTHPNQVIFEPVIESGLDLEEDIPTEITAMAGNFYGSCKTRFSKTMLQQLYKALQNFTEQSKGEFTLYTESKDFWASITGDGSGQFTAHCILNDCDHKYTRLRFQVKFPEENLAPNIQAIEQLLSLIHP